MIWGLNPNGGKIFRTFPDRLWGPPSLNTMGTGSFLGVKRLGCGVDHPPPSSAEVKERVELYLCSPFGPSWPVLGWTLPLPLPFMTVTEQSSYFNTKKKVLPYTNYWQAPSFILCQARKLKFLFKFILETNIISLSNTCMVVELDNTNVA
jgi:hypothetical protein